MYPETAPMARNDLTQKWNALRPLEDAIEQVQTFCEYKNITLEGLQALGAKVKFGQGGEVQLAYAFRNHNGIVTGIKYRSIATAKRYAEGGSGFDRPLVIGNKDSKHWIIAEGETDGARLFDLTRGRAAIAILPSGAVAIRRELFDCVPRGALVFAALDNDDAGERGSTKLRAMVDAIRLVPPEGCNDWAEWPGSSEQFSALVRAALSEAELGEAGTAEETTSLGSLLQVVRHRVDDPPDDTGFATPLSFLPHFLPASLYTLGAYSGDGKTAFALQCVEAAADAGVRSVIFSLEMSKTQLVDRWLASHGVPYEQVRTGNVEEQYLPALERGIEALSNIEVDIRDNPLVDPTTLIKDLAGEDYGFVVFDHLHRTSYTDRMMVERFVRALKNLAKILNIPVLALSQLTPSSMVPGESRFPKPAGASLRDSFMIFAESDAVYLAWRERDEDDLPTESAEMLIAKDRFGAPGHYPVRFNEKRIRYEEV